MPEKKKGNVEFERKARANTGCLRGVLYFLVISGTSLFLAIFSWNCVNDVLSLVKEDVEAEIVISEDFTISELSRELADFGIINHSWLFSLYCKYSKAEEKIEPGTYPVSSQLDYNAIIKSFVNIPIRAEVLVIVPEGKSLLETLTMLSDAGVCGLDDLLRAAEEEEFTHEFLEDVPPGPKRLEGYLAPDSYVFYTDWNPRSALLKMLNNFNSQITNNMKKRLDDIDYDLNQILTIASLIQMEAAGASEMRDISAVIWNRLGSQNKMLQIDATSVYLMGRENISSAADVKLGREIDSPYNTFLYEGLPPGPICSPGIEAIRAALWPSGEKYLYYALHADRSHRFFTTSSSFENFLKSKDFADY